MHSISKLLCHSRSEARGVYFNLGHEIIACLVKWMSLRVFVHWHSYYIYKLCAHVEVTVIVTIPHCKNIEWWMENSAENEVKKHLTNNK